MGTSAFAVPTLACLFEEGFTISGVITQPDKPSGRGQAVQPTPVKKKAYELQLAIYQPPSLKDESALSLFTALAPDLIVVVAYGKILPPWLLKMPRYGAVNLHGSLLPKYRGAAPIHWAVANGDTETGVCTMQVEEGLDTGPVYLYEKTTIGAEENVPQLSDRLAIMGTSLMVKTIDGILAGTLKPAAQDHSKATTAPILRRTDGYIDWNAPATKIHNRVRAFNPWPGALTRFRGSMCKILQTRPVSAHAGEPGTIAVDRRSMHVSCGGSTALEILQLQPENRKPVSGVDFANGARIQPGEKFELLTDNS